MDDTRQDAVLVLKRREIAGLMRPADYLAAVEAAFRAAGETAAPAPMHLPVRGGGFHVKGAAGAGERPVAAFKINGNFPGNPAQGRPTIQGVIVLCDAADGAVLALLDSVEVTLRRTAAATALAARLLARPESATLTVIGCGDQAAAQIEALAEVLPLRRIYAYDTALERAEALRLGGGLRPEPVRDLRRATLASDVIVTCTTARRPFLGPQDVAPGAFVAAVGADSPEKNEIAPALMARAMVVADVLAQALAMGDLRHAVAAGAMRPDQVHAELAEVVAGFKPGRTDAESVTLFDSTGTALQDLASAATIYRRAIAAGVGTAVRL